jgi:hypothetical protein
MHGRGDQTHRGERRGQQRDQVDPLAKRVQLDPALVERHDEQEREQDLDPGESHAQLREQLEQVAIEALLDALVAAGGALLVHGVSLARRARAAS